MTTRPGATPSVVRRRWPEFGWPADVVPAALIGVVSLVGTHFASHGQPDRKQLDLLAIALLVAGPAALVGRRRYPVPVLVAVLAVTMTYVGLGYPFGPVFVSLVVAFFTAVTAGRRLAAWVGAGVLVSSAGLGTLPGHDSGPGLVGLGGLAAWLLVVLTAAEGARVGRERAAEAERAREEAVRRRASEERLRIARELHDVLAHNISLINVQAGVALHLMDEQPEQVRGALAAIKTASGDTLRELRSTLGVLRQVDEELPRQPAHGLADVGELVAGAATAGLAVRTEIVGEARPLPAGVDLAAYRVVQEALTNVRRHAGPAAATVQIRYGDRDLIVRVDDDGAGGTAADRTGSGNGIAGMRERAGALGGQLEAGPRPRGGFRVQVRLPLTGANT